MSPVRAVSIVVALMAALLPRPAAAALVPRIAIIDSGINKSHTEFTAGQVVAWRDFVNSNASPYDDHWHGTAVASRAAGRTLGSAPGAPLVIAKVLDHNNLTTWSRVASAIRWAADQNAAVINISIWSQIPSPTASLETANAIAYAADKGALVVAIGGNGGRLTALGAAVPSTFLPGANAPRAITVGASNPNGTPWNMSQGDPEVIAQGADAPVAFQGGIANANGTSFAAPWVAGIAARMIADGAPRDPEWLAWVIMHCASDRVEYTYFDEGYGLISSTAWACTRDVSAGRRPVPGPDARDAFHIAASVARAAQTGQPPADATPPS